MLGGLLLLTACVAAICADVVFPGSHASTRNNASVHQQIPLDFILRLSKAKTLDDFLAFADANSVASGILNLSNRFGDEEEAPFPTAAVCTPKIQMVELVKDKNPSMLYFPTCTWLEQCGGCCSSELLKCQPTKTQMVDYTVFATQYAGAGQVSVKQKVVVSVEKHLECTCSCAVKHEDCHELQMYDAGSCRCNCLNKADEQRCQADNDTKIWDAKKCTCFCRQIQNCSTGYFYDLNTCRCSQTSMRRRRGMGVWSGRGRRRSVPRMPLPVLPLASARRRQAASP